MDSATAGEAFLRFWNGADSITPSTGREPPSVLFQTLDDAIHRLHVMILQTTPQGVGEELFGQASIEVGACRSLRIRFRSRTSLNGSPVIN